MQLPIRAPKDFWTGLIYMGAGIAALVLGSEYRMGTTFRMGPGYFPMVLATILIVLGGVSFTRAFTSDGPPVDTMALKPLVLILSAALVFAFLLPRIGLALSVALLCIISAAASDRFRFDPKAALGLVVLAVGCCLVFVKGLGVPMPLLGSWLEPVLGPMLPWLR